MTPAHRAACEAVGIPAPPHDAEEVDYGVFVWRRPDYNAELGPATPTSFRWRFSADGRLVAFIGYGWRPAEWTYRSDVPRQGPAAFYGCLSPTARDIEARRLLTTAAHHSW